MLTKRLQLRSGSLISPLHDAIRIAEEWSLVDQLSAGPVAISFGSGWNVNDFVFFPERYDTRRQIMYERIDTIRARWRGELMTRKNTFGKEVDSPSTQNASSQSSPSGSPPPATSTLSTRPGHGMPTS
jgi:alkanesulfonate monooxygenase SsuD/methylene tetrahydromethanopterin reductase-like flavin-dependent oxidoreductase (luciferase family)